MDSLKNEIGFVLTLALLSIILVGILFSASEINAIVFTAGATLGTGWGIIIVILFLRRME